MAPVKKKKKKTYQSTSSSESSADDTLRHRRPCQPTSTTNSDQPSSSGHHQKASARLSTKTKKILRDSGGKTNDPFGEGSKCIQELHDYVLTCTNVSDNFLCEMGKLLQSTTTIYKSQLASTQLYMQNLENKLIQQNRPQVPERDNEERTDAKLSRKSKLKVVSEEEVNRQVTVTQPTPITPVMPEPILQVDSCPVVNNEPVVEEPEVVGLVNDEQQSDNVSCDESPMIVENSPQDGFDLPLHSLDDEDVVMNDMLNLSIQEVDIPASAGDELSNQIIVTETVVTSSSRGNIILVVESPSVEPSASVDEASSPDNRRKSKRVTTRKKIIGVKKAFNLRSTKRKKMPVLVSCETLTSGVGPVNDDDPPKLRPSIHQRKSDTNIESGHNSEEVVEPIIVENQNVDLRQSEDQEMSELPEVGPTDSIPLPQAASTLNNLTNKPMDHDEPVALVVTLSQEDEEMVHDSVQAMEEQYKNLVVGSHGQGSTPVSMMMKTLEKLKSVLTNKYNVQLINIDGSSSQNLTDTQTDPTVQSTSQSYSQGHDASLTLDQIGTKVNFLAKQVAEEVLTIKLASRKENSRLLTEKIQKLQSDIVKAYRFYSIAASHTPDFIGRVQEFVEETTKRLQNVDETEFEITTYEEDLIVAASQEVKNSQDMSNSQYISQSSISTTFSESNSPMMSSSSFRQNSTIDDIVEEIACGGFRESQDYPCSFNSSFGSVLSTVESIIRDGKTWVPLSKVLGRLKAKSRDRLVRYFLATICLLNSGSLELYHEESNEEAGQGPKNMMVERDMLYVCIKNLQSTRANFQETLERSSNNFHDEIVYPDSTER